MISPDETQIRTICSEDVEKAQGKQIRNDQITTMDLGSKFSQAEKSDNAYQNITRQIIDITEENLNNQVEDKKQSRVILQWFVIILLAVQFVALIIMIFCNGLLNIDVDIIETYIVSVFVETLAGLFIMIKFTFNNSQEVELIKVLNSIIANFKKYVSSEMNDDVEKENLDN